MSKIEKFMCAAVKAKENWVGGNTMVKNAGSGLMFVYLHGNLIATINGTVGRFTLAGWNTNVTRSRLRALGVKDFKQVKNDKCWYKFVAEL